MNGICKRKLVMKTYFSMLVRNISSQHNYFGTQRCVGLKIFVAHLPVLSFFVSFNVTLYAQTVMRNTLYA